MLLDNQFGSENCRSGSGNFHNILRLFDVLPNFLSPKVKQSTIISNKHGLYELPHKLLNNSRLRKGHRNLKTL